MKVKILLFSVLLAFLSGCATLEKMVQPPTVKMESMNISDFSFNDITLQFDLLINNPNQFGIQLNGYDYSFVLENNEFLKGEQSEEIKISSAGNSSLAIPLTINFQELYNLVKQTKNLDSLSYSITGNFRPSGLLAGFKIPFSKSGNLPNLRLPNISLNDLKVSKLDFSGVVMELDLKLDNPNTFAFDIGKLDYQINLAGSQVAKGITENLAKVPAKGAGEIRLPISFSFFGVASSLTSALTGKDIDCSINGSAALNTPFGPIQLPINTQQQIGIRK